jgi:transcriptional regulator with XRE-family HTH domain
MDERLQRLRTTLRMEWGQLAQHLGMSRAMLDFVRKGQRNLSFPALARLEEAERSAGIAPPILAVEEAPLPCETPKEKREIFSAKAELRAIASALRELCQRVERLEKRLNK